MKKIYTKIIGPLFLSLFLALAIFSIIFIDYPYKFFPIFILLFSLIFLFYFGFVHFYTEKNHIKEVDNISIRGVIKDYKMAINDLKEKNSYILGRYDALDSIRIRYKKDMDKARKLQESLIPKKLPSNKLISSCFLYKPAEIVGGDFFDYTFIDKSKFLFIISDISGHGVEAAIITSMLKTTFQSFAKREASVGSILYDMNNYLIEMLPKNYYLTATIAEVDIENKKMVYSSASHTSFFIKCKNEVFEYDRGGTILGLFPNAVYEEEEVQLKKDDYILFYTDGIIEASRSRNKYDLYGRDRLKKIFANYIFENVLSALEIIKKDFYEYLSYRAPDDDCTMILFRIM